MVNDAANHAVRGNQRRSCCCAVCTVAVVYSEVFGLGVGRSDREETGIGAGVAGVHRSTLIEGDDDVRSSVVRTVHEGTPLVWWL